MTTPPPPTGGAPGTPAGGPVRVPPKPAHSPAASAEQPARRPEQFAPYTPGDGLLSWFQLRPTIRIRLTLLYGGMFLMAGVVLLVLMYFFVRQAFHDALLPTFGFDQGGATVNGRVMTSQQFNDQLVQMQELKSNAALTVLLRKSLTVLVCLAVIAFMAGYAMAGRVLRPLGRITRTAREVVSSDLHRRIQLDGPDDEL
ncbi:HAMP domain-containing protein, partial [Kitasatospora sp. NPDC001175]|uniref:HAMP domain-containing protein n=1 Tax=Kitasatospora sp. NPDC001175 TaxID=3157103 RepID=UPI003D035552